MFKFEWIIIKLQKHPKEITVNSNNLVSISVARGWNGGLGISVFNNCPQATRTKG